MKSFNLEISNIHTTEMLLETFDALNDAYESIQSILISRGILPSSFPYIMKPNLKNYIKQGPQTFTKLPSVPQLSLSGLSTTANDCIKAFGRMSVQHTGDAEYLSNMVECDDGYSFVTTNERLVDLDEIAEDCTRSNPILRVRTHGKDAAIDAVILHSSIIAKADFISSTYPSGDEYDFSDSNNYTDKYIVIDMHQQNTTAEAIIKWAKKIIAAKVRDSGGPKTIVVKYIDPKN